MSATQKNKKRTFEIPKEMIAEFFTQLDQIELEYELIEVNGDDLLIKVEYPEDQKGEIMELIELLDAYFEEQETEEEEEEDEN